MYLTYVSVAFTTENLKEMPEKREMAEVPDGKMCTNKQKSERGGGAGTVTDKAVASSCAAKSIMLLLESVVSRGHEFNCYMLL